MRHNPSKKRKREAREAAGQTPPTAVKPAREDLRPSEFGLAILWGLRNKPVWQGDSKAGHAAVQRDATLLRQAARTERRGER